MFGGQSVENLLNSISGEPSLPESECDFLARMGEEAKLTQAGLDCLEREGYMSPDDVASLAKKMSELLFEKIGTTGVKHG